MVLSQVTRRGLATAAVTLVLCSVFASPNARVSAATDQAIPVEPPASLEDDVRLPDPALELIVPEAAATGDNRIDALLSGYQWPGAIITYSFYSDSVFGGSYYGTETGVREPGDRIKANARAIMAWYSSIIGVPLVEVGETPGSLGAIRIMVSDFSGYAYTYYPTPGPNQLAGDIHLSSSYDRTGDSNGFQNVAGNHGYLALIHEIGHALGLKHPHTGSPVLSSADDNNSQTVMSYTFVGRSPATPMAYDVLALQYLYGARASRTGADRYIFTRPAVDQYRVGDTVSVEPSSQTQQTIWDAGGYNVLDLSAAGYSGSGYRVDTRPLGWVTTGAAYEGTHVTAGTRVGPGVRLHEVITSTSNDTVYLNAEANVVRGYGAGQASGDDVIEGATAADTVDVSGWSETAVTQTAVGADLVLGLGNQGRLTLRNYYAGARPALLFGGGNTGGGGATVNQPPTAAVTATPASGVAPLTVSLNGAGSADSDGSVVSYGWALAPGVSASGVTTSYTYTSAGTYVVTLTVTDDGGATATATTTIAVTAPPPPPVPTGKNRAPVAVLAADPTSGSAPLTVQFNGTGSSDPDGTVVRYEWGFGTGATATGSTASYTYPSAGTFLATLAVTDNRGGRHSQAIWITVSPGTGRANRAPVAVATATPGSGPAPLPVTLSGAGSSDPDGSVVQYAWTLGDGQTATGATVSHTYGAAGTYVATLTVTDNRGATATATTTVTVSGAPANRPPVAVLTATPTTGRAPLLVTFGGAGSSDPDGAVASYTWTFGDGITGSGVSVTHTYTAPGSYAASLTVTDALGASDTATTPIIVTAVPGVLSTTSAVSAIGLQALNDGGRWLAQATVKVVDQSGNPVSQAVVTGRWTGMAPSAFLYSMTDATGQATFRSKTLTQSGTIGFTVVGVSRIDLTYDPLSNAITTTSLVFTKP